MNGKKEIKRHKQKELNRLKRINDVRIDNLESGFQKWIKYKQLKEYISVVKNHYLSVSPNPDEDLQKRITWSDDYLKTIFQFDDTPPRFEVIDPYPWLN